MLGFLFIIACLPLAIFFGFIILAIFIKTLFE